MGKRREALNSLAVAHNPSNKYLYLQIIRLTLVECHENFINLNRFKNMSDKRDYYSDV